MAIWLVRAGKHGEHEDKMVEDETIYLTWDDLRLDLSGVPTRDALLDKLTTLYDGQKRKTLIAWSSQLWPFARTMAIGDWVVVPMKRNPTIYIGEITGPYAYDPDDPEPYLHSRSVRWIGSAIPRTVFDQDLLYSFGAFLTICRIQRNNAEVRLKAMHATGWKKGGGSGKPLPPIDSPDDPDTIDLEQLARDQISDLVMAKLKGHGLTRPIEAILKAQGYTTFRSPEGPDGGVDIVAGTGPLGFESPRLCVQVKSQDTPVEAAVLNQLKGVMQTVGATEGLLVSWGGFKGSVNRQIAGSFFKVRLWTAADVLEALFENYHRLDAELRAEIPLKQIWTIAAQDQL